MYFRSDVLISILLVFIYYGVIGCKKTSPAELPPSSSKKEGDALLSMWLDSSPKGALVMRDGRFKLGYTPVLIKGKRNENITLHISKKGYQKEVKSFLLSTSSLAAEVRTSKVYLKKREGMLVLSSPPFKGAEITVNGDYRGKTPNRIQMTTGAFHEVSLKRRGLKPYLYRVWVKGDEILEIVHRFEFDSKMKKTGNHGGMGHLSLVAKDASKVYRVFKGRVFLGVTPIRQLYIESAKHQLTYFEIKKNGILSEGVKLEVETKPGEHIRTAI